jgi:hypothetical protein
MAWKTADRVKETSTDTGTGTFDLAGTSDGFQTFVAGIATTNTCYYTISHQDADEWEVGVGTVTDASPDTLSRTTILASSNSGSAVVFSAGTKDVFVTAPASKVVQIGDGTSGEPGVEIKVAPTSASSLRVERTTSGAAYMEMATAVSGQDAQLRLIAPADGKSRIFFGDADVDVAYIDYNHSSNQMRIRTNTTVAMYIDSSQKVSIGDSTADGQLHVESTSDVATLVVKGETSQTANLQEWKNSLGTVLFEVEDDGFLDFKQASVTTSKTVTLENDAMDQYMMGAATVTVNASTWLKVKIGGTTYHIPVWT